MSSTTYATDTYIRTTAEQLWAALTRGELTRRWYFRLRVDSSWEPDAPVVYRDDAGQALVAGTVLSVVPPARLVTTATFLFHPWARQERPTRMRWEVQPKGQFCHLVVGAEDVADGSATATILAGLPIALGNLRTLLEIGRLLPVQTIVLDCAEPARLVAFWAEVTGYRALDPGDGGAALIEPHGLGPRLKFNRVPEPKTVKNRMHPDIVVVDLAATVERLVSLGGRVLWTLEGATVMADPEGNEFCLFA